MILPGEAQNRILSRAEPLPPMQVSLREALDLVLAEPIVPMDDSPPFDNSAKDGYAVRSADVTGATGANPRRLRVLETIPAGNRPSTGIMPGTASKIMTGAPVPDGADAVVMVEDTREEDGHVLIFKQADPGDEIRHAGEDLKKGSPVLEPGALLNPARIALAAAAGYARIRVRPKPNVGIVVTGEELVEPGEPLPPGKIRNSNLYALHGQVVQAGAVPVEYGIVGDDRAALTDVFSRAAAECDVVISSGGVSMGDYDYVIEAARDAGISIQFTRVAQRPGKPMVGGFKDKVLFFGLPGNPVSVMVCFEIYVRPAIRKLLGHEDLFRPTITGTFRQPYPKVKGLQFWTRVVIERDGGRFLLRPSASQRSDILRSMAFGDGLAEIAADIETVKEDQPVLVHLLSDHVLRHEEGMDGK